MDDPRTGERGYVVPLYRAPEGAAWYHFLHGNVPGHQIDFIHRPEVPDGPLTRQHFSHLARLMRYIEPQTNARFAFAVGNLSRDDVQHEPGHGGVALIFGLRIEGVTDHAGRQDPPFAHAIAAIDRALDEGTLIAAAMAFHRHVLGGGASEAWYRAYVRGAQEDPAAVAGLLDAYVTRFAELPVPAESRMKHAWRAGGATPRRIVIVHDDDTPFGEIAVAAARLAAMLYRSDIRWTVITTGREDDVPNGVSIRFVARSHLGSADLAWPLHELDDLPDDEAAIAERLFSATPAKEPARSAFRSRSSTLDPPALPPRSHGREAAEVEAAPGEIEVDIGSLDDLVVPPATPEPASTPSPLPDSVPTLVRHAGAPAPAAPVTLPSSIRPPRGRSTRASWWIAGGCGVLAAGIVAFVATGDPAPPPGPSVEASAAAPSVLPPPADTTAASSPDKQAVPPASTTTKTSAGGVAPMRKSTKPAARPSPRRWKPAPESRTFDEPPGKD